VSIVSGRLRRCVNKLFGRQSIMTADKDDTRNAIGQVLHGIVAKANEELFATAESDLDREYWHFRWDDSRSADWNLYVFQDRLNLYKSAIRRWEEHFNGCCCVVERVRDKYLMPKIQEFLEALENNLKNAAPNQWRCFHCDEVFTESEEAAKHFGVDQSKQPGCQIDVAKYRRLEAEAASYRNEDTALHKEINALQAEIEVAKRRAEDDGYARGLRDAKLYPDELGLQRKADCEESSPPTKT